MSIKNWTKLNWTTEPKSKTLKQFVWMLTDHWQNCMKAAARNQLYACSIYAAASTGEKYNNKQSICMRTSTIWMCSTQYRQNKNTHGSILSKTLSIDILRFVYRTRRNSLTSLVVRLWCMGKPSENEFFLFIY